MEQNIPKPEVQYNAGQVIEIDGSKYEVKKVNPDFLTTDCNGTEVLLSIPYLEGLPLKVEGRDRSALNVLALAANVTPCSNASPISG